MDKRKKDITILAIGDRADYDSYKKFHCAKDLFMENGFEYVTTNYTRLLKGKIPLITAKKVIIFLFFPFIYWNKHIEHRHYKGIYGNRTFYGKFERFWVKVECQVRKLLFNKELFFINDPHLCGAYRDKFTVNKKLTKYNVSHPKQYKISSVKEVQNKLNSYHDLFLKPRYGSMGKGITFLSVMDWQTNFKFKNNKIINRRSDRGWKFRNITGNKKFLGQLLRKDFLIQEAVDLPIIDGDKMDLRVYTFLKKAVYVYPRRNAAGQVTTNISQGGRGDPDLLKILPKPVLEKAKREAEKTSKALDIDLAGIDVVLDHNLKNCYVIDVNLFSGFPKRKTFDLARYLAEELAQLYHKGKLRFK